MLPTLVTLNVVQKALQLAGLRYRGNGDLIAGLGFVCLCAVYGNFRRTHALLIAVYGIFTFGGGAYGIILNGGRGYIHNEGFAFLPVARLENKVCRAVLIGGEGIFAAGGGGIDSIKNADAKEIDAAKPAVSSVRYRRDLNPQLS